MKEILQKKYLIFCLLLPILFVVNFLIFRAYEQYITICFKILATMLFMISLRNLSIKLYNIYVLFLIVFYFFFSTTIEIVEEISFSNVTESYIKVVPFKTILRSIIIVSPLLLFLKLKLPQVSVTTFRSSIYVDLYYSMLKQKEFRMMSSTWEVLKCNFFGDYIKTFLDQANHPDAQYPEWYKWAEKFRIQYRNLGAEVE